MNTKDLIERLDLQLVLFTNEFEQCVKTPLIDSERNARLIKNAEALLSTAKSQLILLEVRDRRSEDD